MSREYQSDKIPPQALDVERTVLGSIMIDGEVANTAVSMLSDRCFYSTQNQFIFLAMLALYNRNIPIDALSVADELKKLKRLEQVGAEPYLSELVSSVATSANIEHHCRILDNKRILRELISNGSTIVQDAFEAEDPVVCLEQAQNKIYAIGNIYEAKDTHIHNALVKFTNDIASRKYGELSGISTGFPDIDDLTGGFQNKDLIVIAGRPSSGKTALACAIMLRMARNGAPVAAFSMEMDDRSIASRMVCLDAKINSIHIRKAILSKDEHDRIRLAVNQIHELPIHIDDSFHLNVSKIRSRLRRLISNYGIKIAFIDHWHLMEPDSDMKYLKGAELINERARRLKGLAKDVGIPIVPLAQLSRESDRRIVKSHRPILSDLREGGEQDADLVMFTHRESEYPPQFKGKTAEAVQEARQKWEAEYVGKAEILIAKQRNGPQGRVVLGFEKQYARFYDFSEEKASDDF
jgi:replicative DNA helicase